MPFALVQLCLWPACLDSSEHAAVTITDNALGIAGQRAQEGAPVGRIGACKRLCEPELGLARDKADAAEDIESHLASGDSLPLGSRARTRKGRWSSSSDPCVGQAVGQKGWNTTGAKTSTQSASNWP